MESIFRLRDLMKKTIRIVNSSKKAILSQI